MDCGECWDEDFGSFTCENCAAKHCITDLHFNHPDEMLKFCGECYHGLAGEE